MVTLQAKQLANAHAFLARMSAADFHGVAALLAPDFKLEFFPASVLPPGGKPTLNREETVEFFKRVTDEVFEYIGFLPPLHTITGPDAVVIHVESDGKSRKSGKIYNNQYMYTFQFCGDKIVRLRQFVDSKYYADFFGTGGVAAAGV
ncbi:SnoaL-like domain-containing protein [Favolaschia claudopus]|uniref:SnoaL-like domain-containing protein n=1 Tax=Favolaschia claudopus TaxID=2862362 RepID=A0AAW0BS99_9AGAR